MHYFKLSKAVIVVGLILSFAAFTPALAAMRMSPNWYHAFGNDNSYQLADSSGSSNDNSSNMIYSSDNNYTSDNSSYNSNDNYSNTNSSSSDSNLSSTTETSSDSNTSIVVASSSDYSGWTIPDVFMSPNNEVPPHPTSTMSGTAQFSISSAGELNYQLNITGGVGITAAHLHLGRPGENGPVIVTLFDNSNMSSGSSTGTSTSAGTSTASTTGGVDISSGMLAAGHVTQDMIQSSTGISNLSDLYQAIRDGRVYVNVHTVANPDGEIRGQLVLNVPDNTGNTSTSTATSTNATSTPSTDHNYYHNHGYYGQNQSDYNRVMQIINQLTRLLNELRYRLSR